MTTPATYPKRQAVFLDRDGVINEERPSDYVKRWEEFVFIPGALEAIALLSKLFARLFIVTNQRGVGRGIMSRDDLDDIHSRMMQAIEEQGGRIDKIYVCCDVDPDSACRKPNIGMALNASRDFPDIALPDSIIAGNSLSDMTFGRNAGMTTVLVGNKYPECEINHSLTDYYYQDLLSFALSSHKLGNQAQ